MNDTSPSSLPCACCCTNPAHAGRPDHCDPDLHRAFREAITRQWPGVARFVMDDVLHAVVACHLELAGRAAGAPHPAGEERRQRYARAMDAVTGGICPDDLIDAVVAVADAEQADLRARLAGAGTAGGTAVLTVVVTAPNQENAGQWADTLRDLIAAEHGDEMRLHMTISPADTTEETR